MRDRRPLARVAALLAALALPAFLAAPVSALERGTRAPEIGLRDRDGNNVQLSALRGKVVLVDFWASWCAPCRRELPELARLAARYADAGVVVLGVNEDDAADDGARLLAELGGVGFTSVHDRDKAIAGAWAPPKMPTLFLVEADGSLGPIFAGESPTTQSSPSMNHPHQRTSTSRTSAAARVRAKRSLE
ncbi:MAG: TlpA family protein disulfide reductase [Myxococcales bacterium]|nr:TlpA family protein disulfide reductase [Myxococcales bacterium]